MFEDFILDVEKEVSREIKGEEKGKMAWFWVSLIFLVAAFVVLGYPVTVLTILGGLVLVAVFLKYHRLGLYLLVGLSPFIGLVVKVPTGQVGFVSEFFGGAVDFPLVDGIAILLFCAWLAKSVYLWKVRGYERWQIYVPGVLFFGAFIGAALLSVLMAGEQWLMSLKYVIRPITFFYLMFLILPYNLIRTKENLQRCFQVFYASGFISAIIGLISLFILPASGILRRATPIAFWGISPLGENHNLLAEILVAALPIGLILFHQTKSKMSSFLLALGNGLIFAIALLTFSRTAWIAIFFEIIVYFALVYRKQLVAMSRYLIIFILLISPAIIYMYHFSTSYVAENSTEARLMLSEIALDMLQRSPILGQGAGTFINYVGNTYLFIFEFGQPMEAHGVLQKVGGEMGLVGLLALALVFGYVIIRQIRSYRALPATSSGKYIVAMGLVMSVGSIVYQLFNTNYYSAKLWIPLALALAATKIYKHEERVLGSMRQFKKGLKKKKKQYGR